MMCIPNPITLARSRSGVTMVPNMKGMFIRVSPSAWLPASTLVNTTVPTNPQSVTLPLFIIKPPWC